MQNKKILKVKDSSTNELLRKPGIFGVGVGKKMKNGVPTTEDAIMVFVQSKVDQESLSKQSGISPIPTNIDGIPTDVFECGEITKMSTVSPAPGFKLKVRPIKPGYSVSHSKVSAGTIGGIFYDKDNDVVILSNFHVLTPDGKAKIGDIIYQPGIIDAKEDLKFKGWTRPLEKLPYIATLKDHSNVNSKNVNKHDSAIAKINEDLVKSGFVDLIYPQLGKPLSGFGTVEVNNNIYKVGRTTGFTTGKVLATSATFQIPYEFGIATFNDCIISTSMSQSGDSGSIGINEKMEAFGLLFAGSNKVTLYNPISHVKNHYGLKIINQLSRPQVTDDIIEWGNLIWSKATINGKITINNNKLTFTDNANHHNYVETDIDNVKKIRAKVFTGTDKGVVWGIGMAIVCPNGIMRLNLRYGEGYGGYYNQSGNTIIGKTVPKSVYILEFQHVNDAWKGYIETSDGDRNEILSIPLGVLGGHPIKLRLGKMGENHGPQDKNGTDISEAGEEGACQVISLNVI